MRARSVIPFLILVALYLLLGFAVFGSSNGCVHGRSRYRVSSRPPRLFLNGETARVAATGKKVVVMSAEWNESERTYFYTVINK